mmetsp:Transcript_41406/g.114108  ORF Transcript_41406/g.114108 Transcript_41406/m.114108 type:complete len:225 (-) Transcript_41406:746-1420(-)
MPALAASVMIATRFRPSWKARCSVIFVRSAAARVGPARSSRSMLPEAVATRRRERPVSSATFSGPPNSANNVSKGFAGNFAFFSVSRRLLKRASPFVPFANGSNACCNRRSTMTSSPHTKLSKLSAVARRTAAALTTAAAPPLMAPLFAVPCNTPERRASVCASPVDHMEMTTCSPRIKASSAIFTARSTLRHTSSWRKKRCCTAQKWRMICAVSKCWFALFPN